MGFGIMLIGYFLAFATSLAKVYFFADIFGGLMIAYATNKLSAYSEEFKRSMPSVLLFFALSCAAAVLSMFGTSEIAMQIVSTMRAVSILILHIYLFSALEDMARGADDEKLAARAKRNRVIVCVYYTMFIIASVIDYFLDSMFLDFLSVFLYFYGLVCIILNLILLHSAYCKLYIEGTAEKFSAYPKFKFSKIGFIRNIQQKYYDSQKRAFDENYSLMQETKNIMETKRNSSGKKKKKKR